VAQCSGDKNLFFFVVGDDDEWGFLFVVKESALHSSLSRTEAVRGDKLAVLSGRVEDKRGEG
jgi:hypothetical protein